MYCSFVSFIVLFLLNQVTSEDLKQAECRFSLNSDVQKFFPLLLKPEITNGLAAFYQPTNEGTIRLESGEVIKLVCPGDSIKVNGKYSGKSSLLATCLSGKIFEVENSDVSINSIACPSYPFHIAKYSGELCLNEYKEVLIGFEVDSDFLTIIKVCFDEKQQNTIYSNFQLSGAIGAHQSNVPRPDFIEDDFYNIGSYRLNTLYKRKTQRTTINKLLGLNSGDTKYIHASNDYFLSRGHFTAKADFIYGSEQRATFHYVNVAPQWQTFNGGNWNTLEMNVRDYASKTHKDYLVYTGSHGIATLPHSKTNEEVELYLYVHDNIRAIPVPKLYWKIVYDPSSKLATAFVGVNNPYRTDLKNNQICKDVCNEISWLYWNANNQMDGYAYCCAVDDFRQTVHNLPEFEVVGLLK